jgi:hypothetical protein
VALVQIPDLLSVKVLQGNHFPHVEGGLVQVRNQVIGFRCGDQGQVKLLPDPVHGQGPVVVPTAQHAKKVRAKVGIKHAVHLIHGQQQRLPQGLEDMELHVAGAALHIAAAALPKFRHGVGQVQLLSDGAAKRLIEAVCIFENIAVKQLKVDKRHPLTGI